MCFATIANLVWKAAPMYYLNKQCKCTQTRIISVHVYFLCRHWVSGHLSFVKGSTPGNSIDLPICLSSICCWHFFFLHYSSVTYWLIHTNLSERITYTGKAELAFFQLFLKDLPSSSQSCISLGIVHNMYRADLNAFCCSKFPESSRKKK